MYGPHASEGEAQHGLLAGLDVSVKDTSVCIVDGTPVLCIGGRSPLDEAAAAILAQLLERHGIGVRCEAREALATANIFRLETTGVRMVCLSYLDASRAAEVRYLVRRVRRKLPNALILAGFWRPRNHLGNQGDAVVKDLQALVNADLYATSLRQAVDLWIEAGKINGNVPTTSADQRSSAA